MSKIKQSNFFKIISIVLITTFIALDISWAYPPEHNTENSTLATPSLLQQNPMTEQAARFQQSVFSQGELLGSVCAIGKYLLEEKLPIKYLDQVISTELGKAASVIDLSYVMVKDGIVLIPCEIKDKRRIIQIALKSNLAAKDLIGYEWLVSDKYVIKELSEDYVKEPAVSPAPALETKEEPRVEISEPVAEVSAPATRTERYHGIINKIFTVRAITVLSALATAVILAFPQFAVAASGESTGFFSSGGIFLAISIAALTLSFLYFLHFVYESFTIDRIIGDIAGQAAKSTGFSNISVFIFSEPKAHLFFVGTNAGEMLTMRSSELLINKHIVKQRSFIRLWKNRNDLLREIIGVDLYQRSVFAEEGKDILATLKRKGYKGEKDLGYQSAFFSEINKRAYPHIGARGAALDVWFYQIYTNPLYAEWRDDKNWIIKQARKYLAKEYSWMNDTQVWEVINEIYKIDSDYFNPKKSSTTLNFIGLYGLGPAALMSVFLAARDFTIACPAIAGVAGLGIGVAVFFAAWRVFFSLSWHVFWLKHGGHYDVSHEETLAKIGIHAIPYLKIALSDKDSFARSKAAEALDKIGWQPESLELKIVYLFAKQRWGALVEIGAPAIPILVKASYDRDLYVSYPAAKALYVIKNHIEVKPLIAALNDDSSLIRSKAAAALAEIRWQPETLELEIAYLFAKQRWGDLVEIGHFAVPMLIKLLSGNKEWFVRSKAAEALGNIRDQRDRGHLIKVLNDVDSYVRLAAAEALDKKGWEPESLELNIAYLFAKQDWEALVKIGAPAIPNLVKAFSDNNLFIRSEAVVTLGNIKDRIAIEPLTEVLSDNNPSIRLEAARALDKIGWDPKTEEQTIAYLFARQDWEALVEIGAPAIPILEKASCYHDWYISSPAAIALGNIKGQQGQGQGSSGALLSINPFAITIGFSVAGLASVLFGIATLGIVAAAVFIIWRIFDPVGWHIYWLKHSANKAAHEEALVIIGTSAVPSLIKLLNYKNPLIRSLAAIALLNIKGKEESAAQRKTALEYVAASATREISQRKEISHADVFEIVRFFVQEEMENLTNALNELKSLSEQTNVSADTISQAIAQAKEKHSLSPDETKILWLALTGPGQGMGDSLENSAKKAEINLTAIQEALNRAGKDLEKRLGVEAALNLAGSAGLLAMVQTTIPSDKIKDLDIEVNIHGKVDKKTLAINLRETLNAELAGMGMRFFNVREGPSLYIKGLLISNRAGTGRRYRTDFIINQLDQRPTLENIKTSHVKFIKNRFTDAGSIFWVRKMQEDGKIITTTIDPVKDPRRYIVRYLRHELFFGDEGIFKQAARRFIEAGAGEYPEIVKEIEGSGRVEILTGRVKNISEEAAAPSTVTQLFEIVESSVNNERAEFIKAGNHLIGLIKAKAVVESAEYFPLVERIDKKMAAAGIRKGLERAISAMEGLEKEDVTPEIRNTAEFLKKNLNQFEADSAATAIIVLARRAKRNNQKLIIGLETDWIPGLDKEKSYQQNAIHTLMQEIYAVGETLKSMGLDNVEVIRGNSSDLANKLLNEADKTHTDLRNVVVMASTTTITSLSFAPLRDADENNRPFLAGIDPTEIIKFYKTFGETLSNQLYIRLTQMLYMTLELAAGKEPPQTPMIVSYDSKQRLVIFLPKAEPMYYDTLRSTYAAEKTALSAA